MSVPLHQINNWFSVAGQLYVEDMAEVSNAGYKSIIINRPDFEAGPLQPTSADVIQAAKAAGLQAYYQPAVAGQLTQADAIQFAQLLKELPKPILAYCQSGGRCVQLFMAANRIHN